MPPKKVEAVTDNVVAFGRVRKNLKMGCVGLPNVGKSSLFNLLTEQSAAAENYPFCTIEPNEARCAVPDARYDFLCDLWKPPSMYPAYLQVTDIAGLIKGASQGEGLGNAFLSHIQAVDGMFHIVRAFDNDQVLHVDDSIDPVRDLNTIQSELCKKDLDILQKTIVAEELIVKKAGGKYKMLPLFTETTNKIRAMLEKDQPVRDGSWTPAEIALINEKIQLITTKPVIYLVNLTMKDYLRQKSKYLPLIAKWVTEHGGVPRDIVPFSIEFEEKLYSMKDDPVAQAEFLKESKVKSRLDKIITEGFTKLGLQYYFTAGEKEIRCWTIPRGCLAPQAAGAIHSDFERGFIKAEVVAYQDFHDLCEGQKSMAPIKAAGKYRQEGKSYVGTQTPSDAAAADLIFSQVVQDGDIIHFQFTVGCAMTTPSIDCYSLEDAHKPNELYDHLPLLPSRRCIRVLDLSSNPKRLLPSKFSCSDPKELVGTLRVVNLDNCPSFTALSYVWGSAAPGEAFITCNSCRIPITTSCYQALASLQPAWGKLIIWVDAICINQKNDEEKNVQIPLMQEIYTWARHVYIWLGPGDSTTKKHFSFLAGLHMDTEFPGPVPWHNGKGLVTPVQQRLKYSFGIFLKSFLSRRHPITRMRELITSGFQNGQLDKFLNNNWLHRAWTFQEIALASSPVLVCGNSRLPWKKFIESIQSLTVIADNIRYDHGEKGWKILQEQPFTPSSALLEWQALVQIWLGMSRPSTWNGRLYRSMPDELSGRTDCSMWEYTYWYKPGEGVKRVRYAAYSVWLAMLAVPICFCYDKQAHIKGLVRSIRERQASMPKDRAFSVDGVLRQLGCVPPDPDHSKSVGRVYHEFTTTLISWEPSFINFLIDTGGAPLADAPSWVPNFHTIRERSWLSSWYTHGCLEKKEWSREELQIKIEGNELSLKGAIIDVSTPLVSALSRIELDKNGSLTPEAIDPFLRVVLFIYHWLAVVRRHIPVPKGYSSMSEGILDILHGPECNFLIQEDDRETFSALLLILINHSTTGDVIDISKTPGAAIAEITSDKRIVDYIVRLCNQVSGKRGLFVSQKGYIGSGPEQMANGDIICIFEGVSAPMVLRKQGDSGQAHQVLGPALVGGSSDLRREQLEEMYLSWETIILV
ncbi:hypothetical protein FDECE_4939 [Fusarium decemcellulare]|nr:hypothetical protein FDECE_4939 [Fusarium decemcellulare]